jgi:predicted NBD/HSP70 family sugar kinase
MNILVIDVGGTHVKVTLRSRPDTGATPDVSEVSSTQATEVRKIDSGPHMSAQQMVDAVKLTARDWTYDAVSIGYPGPVIDGKIPKEPVNLGKGWIEFDFSAGFGKPAKLLNDAAMQALGSYQGGRMLFLGLGTGLGSCMVLEGVIAPMELGHLPYKKARSFEEYVGNAGLKRLGKKKWVAAVFDVVARLQAALLPDYIVLGGGNVKRLEELPPGCRHGDNANAFLGGYRLWENVVISEVGTGAKGVSA